MTYHPSGPESPPRGVRVDWTVPIWGVLGLALQAVGIVWFAATLSAKVHEATERLDKLETRVTATESYGVLLGRLDERTGWIYDHIKTAEAGK